MTSAPDNDITAANPPPNYAPLSSLIRIAMLVSFLFIGLKIAGYGYLPAGDALRDAAQAITGRPFTDILVMFPGYKMNHNWGWDWLLRQLHVHAGLTEDQLVAFSIVVLFFWLVALPVFWFRCPEAWMASLLIFNLAYPILMARLTQARPFLLVEGILMALLLAWRGKENPSWTRVLLTTAAFALAVWAHGTWFLWALLPAAYFLAGQWRYGISLTLCWIAGSLLGALFTGQPFVYLKQTLVIAWTVSQEKVPAILKVGEIQASAGEFSALLVMFLMYRWRRIRFGALLRSPLFWMMAMTWTLGLTAGRFWADWGLPAAMVWVALQTEAMILATWTARPGRRLLVSAMLIVAFFLLTSNDSDGRYTAMLREPFPDFSVPRLKDWAPGKGGIFYTADMAIFYNTFYKNPEGDWRYIQGFEPAWMPPDDLKILRAIQWSRYAYQSYEPWVKKLRPQDRLEINSTTQPNIPQLEWIYAGTDVWIGRLPRQAHSK